MPLINKHTSKYMISVWYISLSLTNFISSFLFLSSQSKQNDPIFIWANKNMRSCLILLLFLASFSHQLTLMVFQWSLSDSKSSQVSRTFLSILTDLNNAVLWMVSIRHQISNSSSTLLQASNYNSYPHYSHVPLSFFFKFMAKLKYLFLFSLS